MTLVSPKFWLATVLKTDLIHPQQSKARWFVGLQFGSVSIRQLKTWSVWWKSWWWTAIWSWNESIVKVWWSTYTLQGGYFSFKVLLKCWNHYLSKQSRSIHKKTWYKLVIRSSFFPLLPWNWPPVLNCELIKLTVYAYSRIGLPL